MAEVSFATQFLAELSSQPARLAVDHVEDARKLPAQPVVRREPLPARQCNPTMTAQP